MLNKIKSLIAHSYNKAIDKCEYVHDVIAVKVGFGILLILSFLIFSLFLYGLYLVYFYDLNIINFFELSSVSSYSVKNKPLFDILSLNVVKLFISIFSAILFCAILFGVPFLFIWAFLKITEPIYKKNIAILCQRLSLEDKERLKL